ncbi:histidine kinase [Paenibacillus sp. PSB04]|uniref:sensor histidine kinase n=1 Tax=Paenibacillus sp. PSB04 TaxID=2866810 RepID=UPI0021F0B5C9|nr:histidine kinase [Paenibacillus sp. PSB04]
MLANKSGRFHRLQWKLTLFYILTTIVVMILLEMIAVLGYYAFVNLNTNKVLAMQVGTVAQNAASSISGPYINQNKLDQALREWPAEFGAEFQGYSAVVDPDGEILAFSGDSMPDSRMLHIPDKVRLNIQSTFALVPTAAKTLRTYTAKVQDTVYIVAPIANNVEVRAVLVVKASHIHLASQTFSQFIPNAASFFGISLLGFLVGATIVGIAFGIVTSRSLVRRIQKFLTSANRWSEGDFSVFVQDHSGDELGQLGHRLNHMAGQLQQLLRTRQDLAAVEERNRLARELHDSIKQQMFAVSIWVNTGRSLIEQDKETAKSHLAEAEKLIGHMQRELNALILALRPIALEGKDLPKALSEYVRAWQGQTGIAAAFESFGDDMALPAIEEAFYRIAQEALSNAARHSGAREVTVRLECSDSITLMIRDNGRGFDELHIRPGVGLSSMRERMAALGGKLDIWSQPGKGTLITAQCYTRENQKEIS